MSKSISFVEVGRWAPRRSSPSPIQRPVHLCPTCFGITRDLELLSCPDCGTEMLARVPRFERSGEPELVTLAAG